MGKDINIIEQVSSFAHELFEHDLEAANSYAVTNHNIFILSALKKYNPAQYQITADRVAFQAELNNVIIDFLHVLDNEIDCFIGIKGVFLASQVYPSNYSRIFDDVDILLTGRNVRHLFNKLFSNGFKPINNLEEYGKNFVLYNKKMPLLFFGKLYLRAVHAFELSKIINCYKIKIEAHYNPNRGKKTKFRKTILQDATKVNFYDTTVYVLEPHDNILYLASHLVDHMIGISSTKINLQAIADIVLCFLRYEIIEEVLLDKAVKYNVHKQLAFFSIVANKILNEPILNTAPILKLLRTKGDYDYFDKIIGLTSHDIVLGRHNFNNFKKHIFK